MSVGPFFRRRLVIALGAAVVVPVLLVALAHAPLVRGTVLRYARSLVEERYGLRLDASRLDYNLATLRIGLANLRVSALHAPEEPFVTADYLSVAVPWRILLGDVAFDDVSATNARVTVRRREDGTTNLPASSGAPAGEPAPLRIQRLQVPQLALDLRDEQTVASLWVPSISLLLTPDEGYIRLGSEAELNTETQATHISRLDGQASFDGRTLHVGNLQVESDEGSARLDGSLTILARDPAADLTVQGTVDATRVARWAIVDGDLPRGSVAFDARTSGALNALVTMLSVSSSRLSWQMLTATDLVGRTRITTDAADVQELRFAFEGGRASATGMVPFDAAATGRFQAEMIDVDAGAATSALAPDATLVPSGRLSAEVSAEGPGIDAARWSGTARVALAPGVNAPGRLAVSGDVSIEIRDGNWRLDGSGVIGSTAPVRLALRGNLDNAIDGTIRVAETDVPAIVGVLDATNLVEVQRDVVTAGTLTGDIRVAGDLRDPAIEGSAVMRDAVTPQVEAGVLRADVSGRPLQRQLEFGVEIPAAVAVGQSLSDIRASGRLAGTQLAIDELAASQPSASGRLAASGTYDISTSRYTATLQGTQWHLAATEEQPASATVDLRFTGEGTTASPRGSGDMTVRDAMWRDIAVGGLAASVELDGDAAHITARTPEFGATARARVDLQSPYATSADVDVEGLDLARLATLANITERVTGTAAMVLHAELPLEMWRNGSATLDVTTLEARAGDLPVRLSGPARIRYERDRAYIERMEVVAGDVAVSASGSLPVSEPVPDAAVLLTATGNIDQVVRTAATLGLTQLPVTGGDGTVALLSRVTGSIQQPVVAADLEVGPASIAVEGLPRVTDVVVRAHAGDGWIELREGAAQYEGGQLSATGKAPLALFSERLAAASGATSQVPGTDAAVIHARATNLSPAVLAPLVEPGTLDELSGSIDLTLDAASPTLELADLTGELRIDRFDLDVAGLPLTQRVPTRIVARDGFARIDAWDWAGEGTSFTVRGQVRLEDREAAILAGGGIDLRLLTPFVRSAGLATAGQLEPRLSITGALDNPRVDGDLVVRDGELRLADPRVLVSEMAARAVVTRTTVRITELTGSVNGGPLTGGGTIEYSAERGLDAQLSTEIRGMALEYPVGLRSELDADLDLRFSASPNSTNGGSGTLSGTVTVLRGAYREPMAVVTGLLATLQTRQLAAGGESARGLEALALDVRVITDEDLLVDNNYARVQLGADLRLIGTAAVPALSGRAELREGGQLFVGRNVYTVNFGAIDFTNPVAIEPNLNVEATTRAGGEDIEVTITGLAQSPTVELRSTSNPELGQAEVASLLLTGRPLDSLSSADAAFIGSQVLGNFSAEALGFASRAVGLDTLRLGGVENQTLRRDSTEVATTREDPTNRITFGKSLASNLDLTLSQSLRDPDAQTWILDYLPKRNLSLRLVSDDDDLLSSGFRHDVAFGTGPARPPRPRPPEVLVARVDVSGDLGLPEARVRDALRLEPGDRFDFADWLDDRDRLEALYRSEGYLGARIVARRADEAEGIALTYSIAAGPLTRIAVTGIDLDGALRARLEAAWFESVFDGFLIEEANQIVRDELARRGYLQPNIGVRLLEEATAKTLQIDVEPGTRSTRVTVRIDGVAESLAADITAHLEERGLVQRAIAQPGVVVDEVSIYLRVRGYTRVQAAAGLPVFTDGTAVLPVRVDPGPVVIVAGVEFEGARTLPVDTLREAAALDQEIPVRPGPDRGRSRPARRVLPARRIRGCHGDAARETRRGQFARRNHLPHRGRSAPGARRDLTRRQPRHRFGCHLARARPRRRRALEGRRAVAGAGAGVRDRPVSSGRRDV